MTEAEFQANVIDLARTLGWRIHHDRADMSDHTAGDPGFPDLVLARKRKVLFFELKSDKGKVRPSQLAWSTALPFVYVWRPADMQEIAQVLAHAGRT